MPNQCKGKCIEFKANHNTHTSTPGRYSQGQKRCMNCVIFIKWEGAYCPCCRTKLRTMPRNRKLKEKFKKQTGVTT